MVPPSDLHALRFFAHPPGWPPVSVAASAERAGRALRLAWRLLDPAGTVVLPRPAVAPARRDGLWEHTCVEAFVAPRPGTAYWEVNVSPAGDWNLYRFDAPRTGMRAEPRVPALVPAVRADAAAGSLCVAVDLDLRALEVPAHGALDVGLAAVLEGYDGVRAYVALAHADGRPDFHRRETFAVRVGAEAGA